MNDSLLVCGFERLGNLSADRQRVMKRERSFRDSVGKRRPLDELHHQRLRLVRFFEAVDVSDVRVIQRGEHLRLAMESSQPLRVGDEGVWQYLQRIVTFKCCVVRTPDLAHATLADEGCYLVGTDASARADGHAELILWHLLLQLVEPVEDDGEGL